MLDCSTVTLVVFVMSIGLLFIDLVPLQENMVCTKGYNNTNDCPEAFFAQNYYVARTKFLNAAKQAKADIQRHVVVEEDGMDYTIDTAFLRGEDSGRLLIHMSGSSGVDGYTGSAIQVKLLSEWNISGGKGPSVLFVHAVNPYGMAHFQNSNEKNVVLTHNYLSQEEWKDVLHQDVSSSYDDIVAPLLLTKSPRFIDRYVFLLHLLKTFVMRGSHTFKQVFFNGQRHHSTGVGYGGREEQRSITILRDIFATHAAASAKKSILLDVHSSYGSSGTESIVVSKREDRPLATSIFTTKVEKDDLSTNDKPLFGFIKPTDILGDNILVVREHFGTGNFAFMVRSVFLGHAAYNYARGSYAHEVIGMWMKDTFTPQTIKYKQAVLTKGINTFKCAWKYLSEE